MKNARLSFSNFYRLMWLFLGILGVAWGVVIGAVISGIPVVGPMTAVTGSVIVPGLMLTLFVSGRER